MKVFRVVLVAVVVVALTAGLTYFALSLFAPSLSVDANAVSTAESSDPAETFAALASPEVLAAETTEPITTPPPTEAPQTQPPALSLEDAAASLGAALADSEEYSYVRNLDIEIYESLERITLCATVLDDTSASTAVSLAGELLRQLNAHAGYAEGDAGYGLLFDDYAVFVGVAPLSASPTDHDEWLVYQLIERGGHDAIAAIDNDGE